MILGPRIIKTNKGKYKGLDLNQIILGCQNKRPEAQKALVQKYSGLLFTICRRYCYRQMDARDVLQDAFMIIFKNFDKYDASKGVLDAWIKRVTINVALQHNKSQKIYPIEINEEVIAQSSREENALDSLSAEEIISLVAKLPTQYRIVFNLYVIDGYSHQEIGAKIGINASTSRSNLSRAKTILKENILENEKREKCRTTN